MTLICGIDEAGRGPVVGPMVIAGFAVEEKDLPRVRLEGAKDSKIMTAKARENVFKKLCSDKGIGKQAIIIISAQEIDSMLDKKSMNLNWLEAVFASKIIEKLHPDVVIMDCPSPNVKAFTQYLLKLLSYKPAITCAHHADANYPIVGAASILAKVTRDAEIVKIRELVGIDFGSGYIADERTADFLKLYWNKFPDIFRHSWAPFKKFSGGKSQAKLSFFDNKVMKS